MNIRRGRWSKIHTLKQLVELGFTALKLMLKGVTINNRRD
jgi:hypothetical protein